MGNNKKIPVTLPPFTFDLRLTRSNLITDWSHDFYNIDQLHKEGRKGEGVKIAVLDTGVDISHSSFQNAIKEGRLKAIDARLGSNNPIDNNGHGTWVVSRYISDGKGVLGFAPNCIVTSYKVLNDNGSGNLANVIRGAEMAIADGNDIISSSLGWGNDDVPTFKQVVEKAEKAGIIWLSASGNDGKENGIDYPALYGEVISVGSHDKDRNRSLFSDFGIDLDVYSSGQEVYGAWTKNREAYLNGTSMATPSFGALLSLVYFDIVKKYGAVNREVLKKLVTCQ